MKIVSTNLGLPKTVAWNNREITTGIFKEPVDQALILEKTDVKDDHVIDRRYHGGEDKACYIYGENHYPFWKERYANLDWKYGMFGENLTVSNIDETKINIGDTYKIGSAIVQVCQPRQPCFKLGLKFEDQGILKEFISQSYSGVYLRVLTPGSVKSGDSFELQGKDENNLSIAEVFRVLYHSTEDNTLRQKIVNDQHLPTDLREYIIGRFNSK